MAEQPRKAVLYARVSTQEQDCAAQVRDLRAFARREGYQVVELVEETGHGDDAKRPGLNRVWSTVEAGEADTVVVWAVDRLARDLALCGELLKRLDAAGAQLVSVQERVGDDPVGRLVLQIMAGVAEYERKRLVERVRSGLAAARARGIRLGRPRLEVDLGAARDLMQSGYSVKRAAKALQVSRQTLARALEREGTNDA